MKRLKKTISGFALVMGMAALSLSLVGCGDSGSTATTAASTTAASQNTEADNGLADDDPIPFVKSGEVYFDLQLGDGVSVSLDGQKVTGKTATLKSGAAVKFEGLDPEGSVDYVMVFATKDQNEMHFAKYIGKGAPNSRIAESMTTQLGYSADKVFVSVFEEGKSWDQNLSAALNKFLTQ